MAVFSQLRKIRLEKLEKIKKLGIEPYPAQTRRKQTTTEAVKMTGRLVAVAGRIRAVRRHGGIVFFDLADQSGKIQLVFKKEKLARQAARLISLLDIGDFLGAQGKVFQTAAGETSVLVKDFQVLVKSLRPLPSQWYGLKEVEERYRQRYLDLLMNPEVREVFEKRAKIVSSLRKFLDSRGFLEVKTPTLQPIYGGASAQPFLTHHHALDIDLYLRISDELYLKRLIAGGFERVYELCTDFRNEGIDRWHNPEFTMLEFYWAYVDYEELLKMTEAMLSAIVREVTGSFKVKYGKETIDFSPPWKKVGYLEALEEATALKVEKEDTFKKIKKAVEKAKLPVDLEGVVDWPTALDKTYKAMLRPKLIQPTFLLDHPYSMRPLAKRKENDPSRVESFQLVTGGLELINAYSELNDPQEQKNRWDEEMKRGEKGAAEYQVLDQDYLRALEYGMPPVAGWGLGIDRFTALLTNQQSLKDVILFPTLRPEK